MADSARKDKAMADAGQSNKGMQTEVPERAVLCALRGGLVIYRQRIAGRLR